MPPVVPAAVPSLSPVGVADGAGLGVGDGVGGGVGLGVGLGVGDGWGAGVVAGGADLVAGGVVPGLAAAGGLVAGGGGEVGTIVTVCVWVEPATISVTTLTSGPAAGRGVWLGTVRGTDAEVEVLDGSFCCPASGCRLGVPSRMATTTARVPAAVNATAHRADRSRPRPVAVSTAA